MSDFKTAEQAIEKLIARGKKQDATNHERWVGDNLKHNPAFRRRLTEQLSRRLTDV